MTKVVLIAFIGMLLGYYVDTLGSSGPLVWFIGAVTGILIVNVADE